MSGRGRSPAFSVRPSIKPGSGGSRDAVEDPNTATIASTNGRTTLAPETGVAEASTSTTTTESLRAPKVAQCTALVSQKRWQELLGCSSELDALGVDDSARKFRRVATVEAASEVIDRAARQALAAANLKEAETLLKQMAPDSVYHKSLSDLFDRAAATKVEEAKSVVDVYLKARDCSGLRLYLSQNTTTTGTEHVLSLFNSAILACGEKVRSK